MVDQVLSTTGPDSYTNCRNLYRVKIFEKFHDPGLIPDYQRSEKFETQKTKTYHTSFLSLKRPDFKYVIFKIIEVSPWNPPAKQHSRFGPIPPNVG